MAVRLMYLVAGSSIMTFTTSPNGLTDGLEKLLHPLNKINIPVHEVAMMMSIALRFIPILLEETDKIMKDQDVYKRQGESLAKLAEEDPTFRAHTNQETGQTIIAGMGELHLEIIVDRLLREFKVEANVGAPQVAYKEAITKAVDIDSKYAKQSGGRGQYGHLSLIHI